MIQVPSYSKVSACLASNSSASDYSSRPFTAEQKAKVANYTIESANEGAVVMYSKHWGGNLKEGTLHDGVTIIPVSAHTKGVIGHTNTSV